MARHELGSCTSVEKNLESKKLIAKHGNDILELFEKLTKPGSRETKTAKHTHSNSACEIVVIFSEHSTGISAVEGSV